MIKLNREHPAFDIGMEVLCSLSPDCAVLNRDLARDLGLKVEELTEVLRKLREDGYPVCRGRVSYKRVSGFPPPTFNGAQAKPGLYAWIEWPGWGKARQLGQEYWDRVYGGL